MGNFCRDFAEDAGAVRVGVCHAVPGSVYGFHLGLQFGDEGGVHIELGDDSLVHEAASIGKAELR